MINYVGPAFFFFYVLSRLVSGQSPCILSTTAPGTCSECTYNFFRSPNMTKNMIIYPNNCSRRIISSQVEINIFVSTKKCIDGCPCDGSQESPFDEINKAFWNAHSLANQKIFSQVNVFLLEGPHYVLRRNLPEVSFAYFKRVNATFTIKPCFCSFRNITGCVVEGFSVDVHIKTDGFNIFVALSVTISNINFFGWDMHLQLTSAENNLANCYNLETICCLPVNLSKTYSSSTNPCGLLKRTIAINALESWDYRFGFLNIEPILDDPEGAIPKLSLERVIFAEMYMSKPSNSWIALIHLPSNVRGELYTNNVTIRNIQMIKGIIFSKGLDYFNPSTKETIALWKEANPDRLIINLVSLFVKQHNNYDVKLGTYASIELGMFSFDSFQGKFLLSNSVISDSLNSATRLAIFSLYKSSSLSIRNTNFSSLDNFMIVYTEASSINFKDSLFINLRIYDGFILKPNSNVSINDSVLEKVVAIVPATRFFIDVDTVRLTIQNVTMNYSQTSIRTYTSTLMISNLSLSNVSLLRTFFQLKDGVFIFEHIYVFNVTSAPLTFRNLLFYSTAIPIKCSISNVYFDSFNGSSGFMLFDFLGSILGFQMSLSNVFIVDSIISTIVRSIQVEMMTLENVSVTNISNTISPGFSVIDSTFLEFLSVKNVVGKNIYSENFFFKVAYCFQSANCLFLLNNMTITNAVRASADWIILDVPIISIQTLLIYNFSLNKSNSGNASRLLLLKSPDSVFIDSLSLVIFGDAIKCVIEVEEALEANVSNVTVDNRNLSPIDTFYVSVISSKGGFKFILKDVCLKNLRGRPAESEMKYKNGFINFFASDTDAVRIENKINLKTNNVFIENSRGWPNGAVGFVNINMINLFNYTLKNTYAKKGGGIHINWAADVTMNQVSFSFVSAEMGGGAFLSNIKNLRANSITAFNSSATDEGGVFHIENIDLGNVEEMLATNSFAEIKGGVFYLNSVFLMISKISILNASTNDEGGVIFHTFGNLSINIGHFHNLISQNGGFASVQSTNLLSLESIVVEYAYSLDKGTSLYLFEVLIIDLKGIITSWNNGKLAKGNICIESQSVIDIRIKNFTCSRNELSIGNCIFYNAIGALLIDGGNFSFNGGNILQIVSKKNSSVTIYDCAIMFSWLSNSSEMSFSALAYFKKSVVIFARINYISKNIAKYSLISLESSVFTIENTEMKNNSASNNESVLTVLNLKSSRAVLKNIKFSSTTGVSMIAFFVCRHGNFDIFSSSVEGCRTESGCVFSENSTGTITNSIFQNNKGKLVGALHMFASNLTISGSKFSSNNLLSKNNYSSIPIKIDLSTSELIAADILSETPLISFTLQLQIFSCSFGSAGHLLSVYKIGGVKIDSCTIQATGGSGLFVFSSNATIRNTSFLDLRNFEGAAIMFYNLDLTNFFTLILNNSAFVNNSANLGGALRIQGYTNTSMSKCNFSANSAFKSPAGVGGVLYLTCLKCSRTSLEIFDCNFFNNFAENYAPTIFSQTRTLGRDSNHFENNKDTLGLTETFFSLPLAIHVSDIVLEKSTSYSTIRKGKTIVSGSKFKFNLTLVDLFGQRLFFESDSLSSLKKTSNIQVVGGLGRGINGLHKYEGVKVFSKPDSNITVDIVVEFDESKTFFNALESNSLNQLSIEWNLYSRPCIVGEIFVPGDMSCFECTNSEFSLVDPMNTLNTNILSQESCIKCPANAICPGGSQLTPTYGYWRANARSTKIIECLSSDFCLGGNGLNLTDQEKIHGMCVIHHSGPMCYVCEKGYARAGSKSLCEECRSNAFLIFKIILTILGLVFYVVLQVNLNFTSEGRGGLGILMKQLLTHAQLIQMISVIDLGWTPDILDYFRYQQYFSFLSEEMVSLDCIFEGIGSNILVLRVISTNLLPFIMTAFMTFVALLRSEFKKRFRKMERGPSDTSLYVKVSVVITIYIFFPEILRKGFTLLNCVQVDDFTFEEVVVLSPNLTCWDETHLDYVLKVALPVIIFWGLVIPFSAFFFLIRSGNKIRSLINERKLSLKIYDINNNRTFPQSNLDNITTEARFEKKEINEIKVEKGKRMHNFFQSPDDLVTKDAPEKETKSRKNNIPIIMKFLYRGYKAKYFYWEFLIFLKKFIMIIISSFSGLFPSNTKATILLVVISLFLLAQARFRPFEVPFLNNIEYLSLLVTFFTANVGVMLYSIDLKPYSLGFLIILIFFNLFFVIYWFAIFVNEALIIYRKKKAEKSK